MGKTGSWELGDHVIHLCHKAMWARRIASTCLMIVCQFGNSPHIFIGLLYQLTMLYTGRCKICVKNFTVIVDCPHYMYICDSMCHGSL